MKKPKANTPITLFAFWRNDSYPYLLGAKVTEMNDAGAVYAPNYQGWIKHDNIVRLLPVKQGEKMLAALRSREEAHREALKNFLNDWDEALFRVFPEARHPRIMRHQERKKTDG